MRARVVFITDIDTEEMFKTSAYLLGDGCGNYFVVQDGHLYIGRYIDKVDAQDHVNAINGEENVVDFEKYKKQQNITDNKYD